MEKQRRKKTGNGFQEGWKNAGNLTIIENLNKNIVFFVDR